MTVKKNQSALLAKYFGMYKKNPRSKVFAPLAESFRRLGMLDDAYKILKEGLRHNPQYTLGYIVLANCYYDQEKYELTYNTLRPIIGQNADNISLQKVFALSCLHLGYLDEALETYKYLLFMNPKDRFFAEQVKKLEDDLLVGHKKLSLDQLVKAPDMAASQIPHGLDDDWVQVDFNRPDLDEVTVPEPKKIVADDDWVMKKSGFGDHPILRNEKITERSLEDDYYADEFEEEGDIEEVNGQELTPSAPIVSHTLIDLYCSQKYFDKAIELLNKILELNPHDEASLKKMTYVMKMKDLDRPNFVESGDEGHDELIQIIETQVKTKSPKELKIQQTFGHFLGAIKEKSLQHR